MDLESQRGNVTLITAFTVVLMIMVVVLGTGLSVSAATSTRVQAASDEAAVTAAQSYIAVVNDEVMFDLIDWGLGFVERMADLVSTIGGIIAAIPFLEGVGAAIEAVGDFISEAVDSLKSAFDAFKDAVNPILDEAKSILAIVNATIISAENGYLGFILPDGLLQAAAPSSYTLDQIDKYVQNQLQITTDGELIDTIHYTSLHAIWGSTPTGSGVPQNLPPCPPNTICPTGADRLQGDPSRDTFHLWPTTPNCPNPIFKRPCDERLWAAQLVSQYYTGAATSLQKLEAAINFGSPNQLFIGTPQEAQAAKGELDNAIAKLNGVPTDPHSDIVANWVQGLNYWDNSGVESAISGFCPAGVQDQRLGPYTSFNCQGNQLNINPDFFCKPGPRDDTKGIDTCWRYWDMPTNSYPFNFAQAQAVEFPLGVYSSLPSPDQHPTDFRRTGHYRDQVKNSQKLAQWKAYQLQSTKGADSGGEGTEAFVQIDRTQPSLMTEMAYHMAGKGDPKAHYNVTASVVKMYRALDNRDMVRVASLCDALPLGPHDDSKLLGFIPESAWGWCVALLGAFDLFIAIYNAIDDFFDSITAPIRAFSFDLPLIGNVCPFCWVADIIDGLVDFVLGPAPPDARTFHISLLTVQCVPALDTVARIARGDISLSDVIGFVTNNALPTGGCTLQQSVGA